MVTKKTACIISIIPGFIMGAFGISWVISFIWGFIAMAIINANLIDIDDSDDTEDQEQEQGKDRSDQNDSYKAKHINKEN